MSWLSDFSADLAARGISRSDRRRIILELEDHIACEPGCEQRLGDPALVAATFADELATDRARGSAFRAFGALVLAALALALSQLAIGPAGGYPGYDHGLSMAILFLALLGIVIAPQVALVTGTLAAWRALRRRSPATLPAAEIGLIRRRTWVAVSAGLAVCAGLELYVLDFSQKLPPWYLAVIGGSAAVAGGALVIVMRGLSSARGLVSATAGGAGDVFDDLPLLGGWRWLRERPVRLGLLASLLVGLAMMVFEAHAERSLSEGVQRGAFEGLAALVGFLVLGRVIGVCSRPARPVPLALPADRFASDEDRSHAETVLRDGYGHGLIGLDELSARLQEVHAARTLGDLRSALRGLL